MQARILSSAVMLLYGANLSRLHPCNISVIMQQHREQHRKSVTENSEEMESIKNVNNNNNINNNDNIKNIQSKPTDDSTHQPLCDENTVCEDFVKRCNVLVEQNIISPEAADDFIYQYKQSSLFQEIFQNSFDLFDKEKTHNLSDQERNILADAAHDNALARIYRDLHDKLNRQQALKEVETNHKASKYNMWIEAEQELLSSDIPANVKDATMHEMKQRRQIKNSADEIEGQKILQELASKDPEFAAYLKKQTSETEKLQEK